MDAYKWSRALAGSGVLGLAGAALMSWYTYSVTPAQGSAEWHTASSGMHLMGGMHKVKATEPQKGQQWTCPMHPQIVLSHPGSCPICGMTLVRLATKDQGSAHAQHSGISIDPSTVNAIGVALTQVRSGPVKRSVDTYAVLLESQSSTVNVTPKFDGWIRQLKVSTVGERVHKGQLLYTVYSPEAQQRQRDYIDLLTRRDSLTSGAMAGTQGNNPMLASIAAERFRMRDRLLAADIPESVIASVERDRVARPEIPVLATQDGVVEAINARQDSFVSPAQPVLVYGDPRGAWAEVTLYQDQLSWLGDEGRVTLSSTSGSGGSYTAPLDLRTAQVDPATRSARVRVRVPGSASTRLMAGDVLNATVSGAPHDGLSVPGDAVLRTGHGNYVMLSLGDGHYVPAEVGLGVVERDRIELTSGVVAGSEVAINGQFLLGAEASIEASRERMNPSGSSENTAAL